MPVPDFTELRSEFPILARTTYLNSCSLGALSRRSEAYLEDFRRRWHAMGASAWYEHWLGTVEELRRAVSGFLSVTPASLALLPSTSVALSSVASCFEGDGARRLGAEGRNRVICTELDFPTLIYQWRARPELELVLLRSRDGVGIDPEQFEDALDERTLFVATSHVFFASGFVQDVERIASAAHGVGAFCLVDGYQGPGQIPVDLGASAVDFYTTGPLKWLCGGPGLSYLRVRPDLLERLEPRITSWFAARNPFDFDVEAFHRHADARRFETGTPALPTVHTALGGQELLSEVGMERVAQRNADLTERLVQGALDAGLSLSVPDDPDRRSAIVMVRHPDPGAAVDRLAARDVIVDHRPGHVRISPHFYNTEEEVDRAIALLASDPAIRPSGSSAPRP